MQELQKTWNCQVFWSVEKSESRPIGAAFLCSGPN